MSLQNCKNLIYPPSPNSLTDFNQNLHRLLIMSWIPTTMQNFVQRYTTVCGFFPQLHNFAQPSLLGYF